MKQSDLDILAHVVVDPDAWYAHALATFGEEEAEKMLVAKVASWKPAYDTDKLSPEYKTRADKEAIIEAERLVEQNKHKPVDPWNALITELTQRIEALEAK